VDLIQTTLVAAASGAAAGAAGGIVFGNTAKFGFTVFEELNAVSLDAYFLQAETSYVAVSPDQTEISGLMNGFISRQLPGGGPSCSAADHRFRLLRRR
jgi:hypothetical protein